MQIIKVISPSDKGIRLDQYLTKNLNKYSRSQIQSWIRSGNILVNKSTCKTGYSLDINDLIYIDYPANESISSYINPEPMKLDILHEDEEIIVLNKPSGLVVHPGKGNLTGTLIHGLLHHYKKLSNINGSNRPGIVHRLDKDTSGIIAIAKTNYAHNFIASQFRDRKVEKEYWGLTWGIWKLKEGEINIPIKRDRKDPTKYKASSNGKKSLTYFKVEKEFQHCSIIRFFPKTGRTHQIRVHAMYSGHPIFGDDKYGGGLSKTNGFLIEYKKKYHHAMNLFNRHALHAKKIKFIHPQNNVLIKFEVPLPKEFTELIDSLELTYGY